MQGHSSHAGSMSDAGHLASGQDSKTKEKVPSNGFPLDEFVNVWRLKACGPRLTPSLPSEDKYLCHRSPPVPGHKFNLSSIIPAESYNFPPPPSNETESRGTWSTGEGEGKADPWTDGRTHRRTVPLRQRVTSESTFSLFFYGYYLYEMT